MSNGQFRRRTVSFEIFARFGKAGSWRAAIFVSYALRSGVNPADAVKAFSGISCSHGRNTCLNAASAALKEILDALPSQDLTPSHPSGSTHNILLISGPWSRQTQLQPFQ